MKQMDVLGWDRPEFQLSCRSVSNICRLSLSTHLTKRRQPMMYIRHLSDPDILVQRKNIVYIDDSV